MAVLAGGASPAAVAPQLLRNEGVKEGHTDKGTVESPAAVSGVSEALIQKVGWPCWWSSHTALHILGGFFVWLGFLGFYLFVFWGFCLFLFFV